MTQSMRLHISLLEVAAHFMISAIKFGNKKKKKKYRKHQMNVLGFIEMMKALL